MCSDNFQQTGWTDPMLARPFDLKTLQKLIKLHAGDEEVIQAIR